jgi:CMP/dCMP kinase
VPVIAIDGPGGAGKSTVAQALSTRLGLERLDTGAMYRAVTLVALQRGISTDDGERLGELARSLSIEVGERVTVDGADVTAAIRSHEVDANVSAVSAHPQVRRELVARQRDWVKRHGSGVVEGRDIGSVVLPGADLKVFLTAHPDVRAERRARDQSQTDHAVAEVRAAIDARDEKDSTRPVSPLVAADGALVIDSSERSVDAIVDEIVEALKDDAAPPPQPAADVAERPIVPPTRAQLWFYAFCRAFAVGLSEIVLPGRVHGRKNVPRSGAYVIAPLHRSDIDFLIAARITRRRLRYLAKASIFVNRPFNWLIETLGAFPVHREATDRKAFDRSLEVLLAGEPLVLFPEGTRHAGPTVGPVREGAAYLALRAGVPIVPLGLAGTDEALPIGHVLVRPTRLGIVVGEPLLAGVERHAETGGAGRVPRSAVHALTEELVVAIQQASDEARARRRGSVSARRTS